MRDIYANAAEVLVWFGEVPGAPESDTPHLSLNIRGLAGKDLGADLYQPMVYKQLRWVVYSLLSAANTRWWERTLVAQEFASARRTPVACLGEWILSWSDFMSLVVQLDGSLENWAVEMKFPLQLLEVLRRQLRGFEGNGVFPCSLAPLPLYASKLNASVPKDKVYALLGFMSDEERRLVTPNYHLSDMEVFASTTYAAISANGSFEVLKAICLLNRDTSPMLPT